MSEKANKQIYGSNATEALADAENFEAETHINIPHEEAMEDAKDWVDSNEK
jgi:hypothetical protein